MVSFADPLANFIVAGIATLILRSTPIPVRHPFDASSYLTVDWGTSDYMGLLLSATVFFNVILGVFNLLPIAPWTASRSHSAFCPATSRSNTARPSNTGRASCSSLSSSYLSCSA